MAVTGIAVSADDYTEGAVTTWRVTGTLGVNLAPGDAVIVLFPEGFDFRAVVLGGNPIPTPPSLPGFQLISGWHASAFTYLGSTSINAAIAFVHASVNPVNTSATIVVDVIGIKNPSAGIYPGDSFNLLTTQEVSAGDAANVRIEPFAPRDITEREATQAFARAVPITPNDLLPIERPRAIYVGGAGDLAVKLDESPGSNTTMIAVTPGAVYPIKPVRVLTATTATGLIALY